ncbi:hypothetical protein M446_2761 [Methylobacterium sp. 4-46]|nr:hypothetical protein M446_2761 [Methylobacterium sp. 4-46]
MPAWMPVPSFIRMPAWQFVTVIDDVADAPRGFVSAAARQAARWNGYYLFQSWGLAVMRRARPDAIPDAIPNAA